MKNLISIVVLFVSLCPAKTVLGSESVSLIKLLVIPERFTGQVIKVKGYYFVSVNNGLFTTKKAAEMYDFPSSIQVVDESESSGMTANCNEKHVEIEGTLNLNSDGYYELTNITYIFDFDNNDYCWRKR